MATPTKWGSEFLVNTTTARLQNDSAITALANGRIVVSWTDLSGTGDDSSEQAIRAQVFNADGTKSGAEFLVNTTTASSQNDGAITALTDGRFVISWTDASGTGGDTSGDAVRAQVFNADGTKSGAEFLVNTTTTMNQDQSGIMALTDGRFVISWTDRSATSNNRTGGDIRAQIFNADGTKSGDEFQVNATSGLRSDSVITALADGRFVISWTDQTANINDEGFYTFADIRAQVFNADGTKSGDEFLVNTTTVINQIHSAITALTDGRFVASWTDVSTTGGDTSQRAIRAQVFNADGTKSGAEFLVNTTTTLSQDETAITALADGRFVVSWTDQSGTGDDTSDRAVRAQVFNADGTMSGTEFLVNTTTTKDQDQSAITALADGRFVVSWTDQSRTGDDTSGDAIRAQIFDPREASIQLEGTPGDDMLYGTVFDDNLWGRSGADILTGAEGNDWIAGNDGDDQLNGHAGKDTLLGGTGDDTLDGGLGSDLLRGQDDNDRLDGGIGRDKLFGGSGDDLLIGSNNADRLDGGPGNDTLTGGGGRDKFVFAPSHEIALITDFEDGKDKIDLRSFHFADAVAALAFAEDVAGDVVFTFAAGNVLTVENMTKAQFTDVDFVL